MKQLFMSQLPDELLNLIEQVDAGGVPLEEFEKLKAEVEKLKTEMEGVISAMSISEAEFQSLQNQTNSNTEAVGTITTTLGAIQTILKDLQKQIDGLNTRVISLEGNQLNLILQNLSFDSLDENPVETGIQISKNITLPTSTSSGATIEWSSSNAAVITNDGTVLQPSYSVGDQVIVLTATVTYGEETKDKDFTLVITAANATNTEMVNEDKNSLTLTSIDDDSATAGIQVAGNKSLPTTGKVFGSTITWVSSDSSIFNIDGTVTRPTYNSANAVITLTATITKGDATEKKTFTVTVLKAEPTDAEKVIEDKNTLLMATTQTQYDITLQSVGAKFNSVITWSSDKPSYISNSGVVTQPTYLQGDQLVTLAATITNGTASDTKSFTVNVPAKAATESEKLTKDADTLSLASLDEDTSTSGVQVSKNKTLPTSAPTFGSTVTWASADPAHFTADGIVTQPAYSEGIKPVTLTATITRNGETLTRDFVVNVLFDINTMTDQDKAYEDANLLSLANLDEVASRAGIQVSKNLVLPSTGSKYSSTITWASSNTNYITNDGKITRPTSSLGEQSVTMTATIKNATGTTTKQIVIVVLTI